MSTKSPKDPKPPKEKKIFHSSRGGAGRSKSVGPAARTGSNAPSRILEVPVPTHRTTSTGRGGGGNGRTFVVEDGTFERVLEYETGKIKASKNFDPKRKMISLRGGTAVPIAKDSKDSKGSKDGNNSDKSQVSTRISLSDDNSSTRSIIGRLPRVPSFSSSLFFRDRDGTTSPRSSSMLEGPFSPPPIPSIPLGVEYGPSGGFNGKHCPTCQCSSPGHATSTQSIQSPRSIQFAQTQNALDFTGARANLGLDLPSHSMSHRTTPPPSPFRQVFPGVMLYVPDDDEIQGVRPPSSPTSSVYGGYYRESEPSSSTYTNQYLDSRA